MEFKRLFEGNKILNKSLVLRGLYVRTGIDETFVLEYLGIGVITMKFSCGNLTNCTTSEAETFEYVCALYFDLDAEIINLEKF